MSFFLGKKASSKPEYTGVQIQTSSQDVGLTIAWGQNRFAPNVMWYGDFASHKQKQKAGKGGGTATSYTYSASFELGLCEGPINGIGKVWKDQDTSSTIASLGLTLFDGSYSQNAWGYLTTKHPEAALNYRGVAYLASANYDLGQSATLPQFSYEVSSQLYGTGHANAFDADCALVIQDFLTSPDYGVLVPATAIDFTSLLSTADAPTTGDRAYQTYCRAMGWGMSPVLSDPEGADSILDRWTKITNTAVVWTGYTLKFIPQAYGVLTANGVTYRPDVDPLYSLTDKDFISSGEDPVSVSRIDPTDCKNSMRFLINDRTNSYNSVPVPWKDQGLIDQYGLLQDSDFTANEITDTAMASICASLYGKRGAYIRNTITLTLGVEFTLLEAMDIIEITDPKLGTILIEIRKITENDDSTFEIEANELQFTISETAGMTIQPSQGHSTDSGVAAGPVNDPIIFEPPASLSGGVSQIWAAVSGGNGTVYDSNWGGANVYVSADGGGTYQQVGQVTSAARQGTLTSALALYAGANPDTAHTLAVNLAMSNGDLQSVSTAEAAAATTACVIKDSGGTHEFLSFETATLTSTSHYSLTSLYRGLYQSTGIAHSSGAAFARLDDNIFMFDLPAQYIGIALKFKLQSFNIWGNGVQDLADCVEYDYTPVGTGISTGAPVYTPPGAPTGLSGTGATKANNLSWTAPASGAAPDGYHIYGKVGASGVITAASLIGTTGSTFFTHAGLGDSATWRYWVRSFNAGGENTAAIGPLDLTTSSSAGGSIEVDDEGTPLTIAATKLNLKGAGITGTLASPGVVDITVSGYNLEVDKAGASIVATATKLNFTGAGVTVTTAATGEADIDIPGGGGGGVQGAYNFVKIAQQILGSAAATVTFTSLTQIYDDLLLVVNARGDTAATNAIMSLRFNADTGANYDFEDAHWFGSGTAFAQTAAATSMLIGYIPAATAPANYAGMLDARIGGYSKTAFAKAVDTDFGAIIGTGSNAMGGGKATGMWRNTAAITSLTMLLSAGNFAAGSSFTLYGRGGTQGVPYRLSFFFTNSPIPNEVMFIHTFSAPVSWPINFTGSTGKVGTNPASSITFDVQKNGTSIGSMTISTSGVVAFTIASAQSFAINDQLKIVGPASSAGVANASISLVGQA